MTPAPKKKQKTQVSDTCEVGVTTRSQSKRSSMASVSSFKATQQELDIKAISKLQNTKNYKVWAVAMKTYLKCRGFQSILKRKCENREAENGIAINLLLQTTNTKFHNDIIACSTLYDAWNHLEKRFLGSRETQLLDSLSKIQNISYRSIDEYVRRFTTIAADIRILDASFTEHHLSLMFMATLPQAAEVYRSQLQTLKNLDETYVSLQAMMDRLHELMPRRGYYKTYKNNAPTNKSSNNGYQKSHFGNSHRNNSSNTNRVQHQRPHKAHKAEVKDESSPPTEDSPKAAKEDDWAHGFTTMHSGFMASMTELTQEDYVIDSGATTNTTGNKDVLTNYRQLPSPITIIGFDKKIKIANFCGDMNFLLAEHAFSLKNVLHVPGSDNLISCGSLADLGFVMTIRDNIMTIDAPDQQRVATVVRKNGLYIVRPQFISETQFLQRKNFVLQHTSGAIDNVMTPLQLWHFRLGHISANVTKYMVDRKILNGVALDKGHTKPFCDGCCIGLMERAPVPKVAEHRRGKASKPLERLHADLVEMKCMSNNSKYFVVLTDEHTGYKWIIHSKTKSVIQKYIMEVLERLQKSYSLIFFHCDNGPEFVKSDLKEYLIQRGVTYEESNVHTPEQNGTAERANKSVLDLSRTLLLCARLRQSFWYWSTNYAVFLLNRRPVLTKDFIPYEKYYNRTVDITHIRTFGAKGYGHFAKPHGKYDKLNPRGIPIIFLGMAPNRRAYTVWVPQWNCWKYCRTVQLDENSLINEVLHGVAHDKLAPLYESLFQPAPLAYSELPERVMVRALRAAAQTLPHSYQQILRLPEPVRSLWLEAYQKEIDSLTDKGELQVVSRPAGAHIIPLREVFTIKEDNVTHQLTYKVRICCRGDLVRDYDDTYAPVVGADVTRLLLSLASIHDLKLMQADVSTAFLHARDSTTRYYHLPNGHQLKAGTTLVWQGRCALYGLKNAPRLWNICMDKFLADYGFEASEVDQCLYVHKTIMFLWLILYVDDLLMMAKKHEQLEQFRKQLERKFAIKYTYEVTEFIGLQIERTGDGMWLHHTKKIENMVSLTETDTGSPVYTPMIDSADPENIQGELFQPVTLYQSILGMVNYTAQYTRPDIALAVNLLARANHAPRLGHYRLLKKVVKYLHQTKNYMLYYGPAQGQQLMLNAYVDANFQRKGTGRSTYGYAIYLNGHLIKFKSKRFSRVAHSTCEAEALGIFELTRDLNGVKLTIQSLGLTVAGTEVHGDNTASLEVVTGRRNTNTIKDFTLYELKLRQQYRSGEYNLSHVPSEDNTADIFTKPLPKGPFIKHRNNLLKNKESGKEEPNPQ